MHVRVRCATQGGETVMPLPSRLSTVDELRRQISERIQLPPGKHRLFYGGKLLEDGYTLHDYNIKLNDVIQLMPVHDKDQKDYTKMTNKEVASVKSKPEVQYEDAVSKLYKVGDLIDARNVHRAWFEGKIEQIATKLHSDKDSDKCEIRTTSPISKNGKNILDYFNTSINKNKCIFKDDESLNKNDELVVNGNHVDFDDDETQKIVKEEEKKLVFRVLTEGEDELTDYKLSDIRPRSRKELKPDELKVNQTVMLNYNIEDPNAKGFWYDFTVHEIVKQRTYIELYGTICYGIDVYLYDIKVKCHDKIFAIEKHIPLTMRTKEQEHLMTTDTGARNLAWECTTCKDNVNVKCKQCGCYICSRKEDPDKIILCDECNLGYHLFCLKPPLLKLPEEDWYCPKCRRDMDEVIAPGKQKQQRKDNQNKKDWGRGMACVGKSQTCALPPNHFGPIPGIEVGMGWRFRIQMSESGIHRPPVSGIHGRDVDGAYSIVLSGGYEDDVDNGYEFTYTGSGGRDLSGNRRTADQSSDQTLTRENRALARNCAVEKINEEGADAKDNWRKGKPVRVVRSYKMAKFFPDYAPKEGIRYDGIYKVVKYYPEKGKAGYTVWKYLLKRDDPSPAPWENNAKKYPVIYPDGYLEAEAAKRALKASSKHSDKKNILKENNFNTPAKDLKRKNKKSNDSPPAKRMKTRSSSNNDKKLETPRSKRNVKKSLSPLVNPFTLASSKKNIPEIAAEPFQEDKSQILLEKEKDLISKDIRNQKIWNECIELVEREGKHNLVNKISDLFLCIICQDLAANPVTTNCGHNFCNGCLKLAFKSTNTHNCPYCRTNLTKDEIVPNDCLKEALRYLVPGYDRKRK